MYLVVLWVTISAPHSKGRQLMGVAKVLSTISGTPCSWATLANFSKSSTVSAGLAMLSANSTLVLDLNAAFSSSSVESGLTSVHSTPILGKVTVNRLVEPP